MSKFELALVDAINYWNGLIEDEWYFVNFRENNIAMMTYSQAFENIDLVVNYLLKENDLSTAIEILQTLLALSRYSDTTKIPQNISQFKDLIKLKFEDGYYQNKVDELLSFYRII